MSTPEGKAQALSSPAQSVRYMAMQDIQSLGLDERIKVGATT